MKIADVAQCIENIAPLPLQEDYDNAGLLTGDPKWECLGVLCTLDITEEVVKEAILKNCNCIVAHHPVIFRGLKKLTSSSFTERVVISALKNDIAIYAAHTNVDNILQGVNGKIADKLGLTNRKVLAPKQGALKKLYTFVPPVYLSKVRDALFKAGAGNISNYSECSFTHPGTGTFKPGEGTNPFSGKAGERQEEQEIKLELIMPSYAEKEILNALFAAHPYEEVAYDIINLANSHRETGSGLTGEMEPVSEEDFLKLLSRHFNGNLIRHTPLTGNPVSKVAICGGSGSFLISNALRYDVDAYVTADIRYHDFFEAVNRMLLCDIGHFESEQFTTDLFIDLLLQKFPTFAVLKSEVKTNPVNYFTGK